MSCMLKDVPLNLNCIAFRQNVASFRDSFGLLLPNIADHFKVGRAEAALTSSFMTLLTLGSGRYYCAMKSPSFKHFNF